MLCTVIAVQDNKWATVVNHKVLGVSKSSPLPSRDDWQSVGAWGN